MGRETTREPRLATRSHHGAHHLDLFLSLGLLHHHGDLSYPLGATLPVVVPMGAFTS